MAVFLDYNQYRLVGLYGFVVLCPGAYEDSPAVVLILKRLRRQAHGLKSGRSGESNLDITKCVG